MKQKHHSLASWSTWLIVGHLNLKECAKTHVFCGTNVLHPLESNCANVLLATTACNFWTSKLRKPVRWRVLYIFTSKCASGHSRVQFFDIRTSKNCPLLTCFAHFDFIMCFSPQPRAIFGHQNFKKCSIMRCFVHLDLKISFSPQLRAIFRHQNFKKCSQTPVF